MDKSEKNYTVIAYSVGGSNNKVYKSGDKVKESNFPPGNAEDFAKQGFLKELTKAQQIKVEKTAKTERYATDKAQKDTDLKALKEAESAVEEADMAVTIVQENINDLSSQLEGDVSSKTKKYLGKELRHANNTLKTAKKTVENAKNELEVLKSS